MKLKFNSNLEYQKEAISSVIDLFEGSPINQSPFEINMSPSNGMLFGDMGVGNFISLDDAGKLKNLHMIQERNSIIKSNDLVSPDSPYSFPNFSVEMETGTGKTVPSGLDPHSLSDNLSQKSVRIEA
jgi:type III restriction enzyme